MARLLVPTLEDACFEPTNIPKTCDRWPRKQVRTLGGAYNMRACGWRVLQGDVHEAQVEAANVAGSEARRLWYFATYEA